MVKKLLEIGAAQLSKNGASVFTNWDLHYKLRKNYYKLRPELQIRAIITH